MAAMNQRPTQKTDNNSADVSNDAATDNSREASSHQAFDRFESHFAGVDGDQLYFQSWSQPKAKATLVITHGISEHSDCYARTAEALVQLGWNVIAWDLRGHGRSSGKRGYVKEFSEYSEDLSRLIAHLGESGRLKNDFALVGHSMGGLITLKYILDHRAPANLKAVVLSSPLMAIAVPVPPVKSVAAKVLLRLMPKVTLFNEIKYDELSRDLSRVKAYPNDPLRHDKISPGLYFGMLETMTEVIARAEHLRIPLLIVAAGKDKIVSTRATEEFFDKIGTQRKMLKIYPDSYHEIFNDLDRDEVFRDMHAFLSQIF